MLFHVYDDPKPEGYYSQEPDAFYRTLLDADWILYLLLPLLLVIIVWLMMVAWRIHELPAHKADHKKMRQAELVSALTLLGLFMHWVWAIALFFAYVDWDELENTLVRILRRSGAGGGGSAVPEPTAVQSQIVLSTPVPPVTPKSEEGSV
jgi:hypothetical protein